MTGVKELLNRCLVELQKIEAPDMVLVDSIKEHLAQPEQESFKPHWVNYRQGFEDGLLSKGEINV